MLFSDKDVKAVYEAARLGCHTITVGGFTWVRKDADSAEAKLVMARAKVGELYNELDAKNAEIERLRTALFWLTTDAEAWHQSWALPTAPTKHEIAHLKAAKEALNAFTVELD